MFLGSYTSIFTIYSLVADSVVYKQIKALSTRLNQVKLMTRFEIPKDEYNSDRLFITLAVSRVKCVLHKKDLWPTSRGIYRLMMMITNLTTPLHSEIKKIERCE
jgi:hypothetical protein